MTALICSLNRADATHQAHMHGLRPLAAYNPSCLQVLIRIYLNSDGSHARQCKFILNDTILQD